MNGEENKVLNLTKILCRMKQFPRVWKKRIDEFLMHIGYSNCTLEHVIYVKGLNFDNITIMCLCMDDHSSHATITMRLRISNLT